TPIGLLERDGEVIIERLINQLHAAGVYTIDIIVGFLEDKFEYLKEKYDVNIIYNSEYASKGNYHALNLRKDAIENTYILPANIWAEQNPFSETEFYSWFSVSDTMDDHSEIRLKPQMGL